jgi:hypothetical protein
LNVNPREEPPICAAAPISSEPAPMTQIGMICVRLRVIDDGVVLGHLFSSMGFRAIGETRRKFDQDFRESRCGWCRRPVIRIAPSFGSGLISVTLGEVRRLLPHLITTIPRRYARMGLVPLARPPPAPPKPGRCQRR